MTITLDKTRRAADASVRHGSKRVGLLTPYNGGNLGDAAIMHAVISQIRRRIPDARIHGITLGPADTTERHGIEAFPLTGISLPFYAVTQSKDWARPVQPASAPDPAAQRKDALQPLKDRVKRTPLIGGVARLAYDAMSEVSALVRQIARDCVHTVRAFRFLRGMDVLLVSGGGQIDDYWGGPWAHPYALLKWTALAKIRRVPVALLSLGVIASESRLTRIFTYLALRLAHYRSYRDEGSKRLMAFVPGTQDDPVVPDLAFSLPMDEYLGRADDPGSGRVIGVSPIAYLYPKYWPRQEPGVYDRYLDVLAEFVTALIRAGDRVVLFSSASPDRHVIRELRERVASRIAVTDANLAVEMPFNFDELLRSLRRMDVIVASRLHGIIMSHLSHKPTLAISYSRKVDAHMADARLTDYCLDINNVTLAQLTATFARLETNRRAVEASIRSMLTDHRSAVNLQFDRVLSPRFRQ